MVKPVGNCSHDDILICALQCRASPDKKQQSIIWALQLYLCLQAGSIAAPHLGKNNPLLGNKMSAGRSACTPRPGYCQAQATLYEPAQSLASVANSTAEQSDAAPMHEQATLQPVLPLQQHGHLHPDTSPRVDAPNMQLGVGMGHAETQANADVSGADEPGLAAARQVLWQGSQHEQASELVPDQRYASEVFVTTQGRVPADLVTHGITQEGMGGTEHSGQPDQPTAKEERRPTVACVDEEADEQACAEALNAELTRKEARRIVDQVSQVQPTSQSFQSCLVGSTGPNQCAKGSHVEASCHMKTYASGSQ